VVGEKARVLEKRGRTDVIAALKKHDIGYHSNFHSVHPAPAEYLKYCDLLDGVAEFTRREQGGAADVRRIFGVNALACYGQPGSSWAPQTIVALPAIGVAPHGVGCYVDSGNHVGGMGGKPFWYCGGLVVYDMKPNETRMDLHDPAALEPAKKTVSEIAAKLASQGGGLISIYYHPCEWVHKVFWDGVNFGRGANPPREQWKAPPQRPAEETEAAFERFGAYIDHIRSIPGITFVTASQLPELYPDRLRTDGLKPGELRQLADTLASPELKGLDDMTIGSMELSPADEFELLTRAVASAISSPKDRSSEPSNGHAFIAAGLIGPDGPPPQEAEEKMTLAWPAFRDATLDVADYLRVNHRVPPRVFIGPDPVPPADFLVGLARAWAAHEKANAFPDTIDLGKGVQLLTASHIAQDRPNLYGGWVIHRANFRAPHILDVARLQTWTLKPATRREAQPRTAASN
jgi:hypothetical protein